MALGYQCQHHIDWRMPGSLMGNLIPVQIQRHPHYTRRIHFCQWECQPMATHRRCEAPPAAALCIKGTGQRVDAQPPPSVRPNLLDLLQVFALPLSLDQTHARFQILDGPRRLAIRPHPLLRHAILADCSSQGTPACGRATVRPVLRLTRSSRPEEWAMC